VPLARIAIPAGGQMDYGCGLVLGVGFVDSRDSRKLRGFELAGDDSHSQGCHAT